MLDKSSSLPFKTTSKAKSMVGTVKCTCEVVWLINGLAELDKERSTNKRSLLGGSLFAGGTATIPPELEPISTHQIALSRTLLPVTTSVSHANTEYEKLFASAQVSSSLPVRAAQLSGLLKSLASAENAVNESIKARNLLIEGLERLLEQNHASVKEELSHVERLRGKREKVELEKNGVEDAIMQGLSSVEEDVQTRAEKLEEQDATDGLSNTTTWQNASRPDVEPLTPPPQSTTPPFDPPDATPILHPPNQEPAQVSPGESRTLAQMASVDPRRAKVRPRPTSAATTNGVAPNIKRRKTSQDEEFGGFSNSDALEGLDKDVVDMLG